MYTNIFQTANVCQMSEGQTKVIISNIIIKQKGRNVTKLY